MADLTPEQAGAVLTAALSAPGSGESVLAAFADVPSVGFTPARPGRLFRSATPTQLAVGQRLFAAVEPGGTRLRCSHVVRGVALRTDLAGPATAGPMLAEALVEAAREYGPQATATVQAILYGIAVVHGLA
ncbi:MAG TPA: DUF5073 family protein [Mycobacteriales bacterium]|nr:DUF5073 family protein [Mycobacteriales bacterium]